MPVQRRRSKYPWAEWTDGEWHTIWQGEDYTLSTYCLQISLHGRAKTEGKRVTSRSLVDRSPDEHGFIQRREGLLFQFSPVDP